MANPLEGCTLYYFGIVGLGEPVRMALRRKGIKFEDHHIAMDFSPEGVVARNKIKTDHGLPETVGFPILKLADGTVMNQSRAILNFVGHHTDLYPTCPKERFFVDHVIELVTEARGDIMPTMYGLGVPCLEGDEGQKTKDMIKKSFRESYGAGKWQQRKQNFLDALNREGKGGVYFANGKVSIADFLVWGLVHWLGSGVLDGIDNTVCPGPELAEWKEQFAATFEPAWTATKPQ